MTQEEIRELLGGYATNTLTERERAALFEAALEDQDLFNALQNEDALRELLADPLSREQVRQALQQAAAGRSGFFWRQPWRIGAASLAGVAVIAIAVVIWQRQPAITSAPTQLAQTRSEPKPELPLPAPVVPRPARKEAARGQAQSVQLAAPAPAGLASARAPSPAALTQDLKTGIPADAPLYTGPLVRYTVQRSGPSGDAVRIQVVSEVAGYLALYRADTAGQWQRVFPVNGAQFPIAAKAPYLIPDDPMALGGKQDKLRLVIEPAAASAPLVVEIPIGTGN